MSTGRDAGRFGVVATGGSRGLRWEDVKDRVDLVQVARSLLGEPPGRRGEKGRRVWWNCPLHADANPSFCCESGRPTWRCFGCGESGDAASLVMKIRGVGFREAITFLATGASMPVPAPASGRAKPTMKRRPEPVVDPDAMTNDEAVAMVEEAAGRIWQEEESTPLSLLRTRGLSDDTIRSARLGWTPRASRVAWTPPGLVIPWFRGETLVLVKVRPDPAYRAQFPEHRRPPKYIEVYRHPYAADRDDPPIYPSSATVRTGLPLVVVEGELDCLLLGQELAGLASVITLGGASFSPGMSTLTAITPSWPRYAAQDDDAAGDKAAGRWPGSFRRVVPPGTLRDKDWSDAFARKIDLRRWWSEIFSGCASPTLYTWSELEAMNPPDPPEDWSGPDPYDALEREAIVWVSETSEAAEPTSAGMMQG